MAFFQTDTLWVNELADGVAVLVLDVPGQSINQLTPQVLADLETALERVGRTGHFRLLMIRSGKEKSFAAGPGFQDLEVLQTPQGFANLADQGQRLTAQMESLPIPTAALISGECLGGGLELALACDYRLVVADPTIRLGILERDQGLLPTWGGTQRLPALVGLERSLHMLLARRQLDPATALAWGLADTLVGKNQDQPPEILDHPTKRTRHGLPLRTWRQKLVERFRWGCNLILRGFQRRLQRRGPSDLPAPAEIFEAVRIGLKDGKDAGLAQERTALVRLSQSQAFGNLLRFHSLRQKTIRKWEQGSVSHPLPRRVGIVGSGTWETGLVYLLVSHGCSVVVREKDETLLGMVLFQTISRFQQNLRLGTMTPEEVKKLLAAINGTTAWKGFAEVDLVLDASDITVNRTELWAELEKQVRDDSLLVSASPLDTLRHLRQGLQKPQQAAGLHMLDPTLPGSLVEVVQTEQSSLADYLSAWAVDLGNVPVQVRDKPGLLVQRLRLAALHEAVLLLQERVRPQRIDEDLRHFGMLRGPLELADLMGLDRISHLASILEENWPGRFLPGEIFQLMAQHGWLGYKTKLGFYRYGRGHPRPNYPLLSLIQTVNSPSPKDIALSHQDQRKRNQQRIILRLINEAAWCLEEGVVDDAATLDLAMCLADWPAYRGGPLTYARQQGIENILRDLESFTEKYGPRFIPCPTWT